MDDTEWSYARGYTKAAIHVPIRMAVGLAAVVGGAWAYNRFLQALGVTFAPMVMTIGVGLIVGGIVGMIMCAKLSDATGFAGRSLLPFIASAILATHVAALYVAAAVVPWSPAVLMWLVAPSASASLAVLLRILWVDG